MIASAAMIIIDEENGGVNHINKAVLAVATPTFDLAWISSETIESLVNGLPFL
jgi:hypothetical protein